MPELLLLARLLIASRGIEAKKPGGIAAEDVALLVPTEKRSLIDDRDRWLDNAGPIHLVRSEHDPLAEPSSIY